MCMALDQGASCAVPAFPSKVTLPIRDGVGLSVAFAVVVVGSLACFVLVQAHDGDITTDGFVQPGGAFAVRASLLYSVQQLVACPGEGGGLYASFCRVVFFVRAAAKRVVVVVGVAVFPARFS